MNFDDSLYNVHFRISLTLYFLHPFNNKIGSGGGVVVLLLPCRARGPGFDPRPRCYDFRDWVSLASKSRYD